MLESIILRLNGYTSLKRWFAEKISIPSHFTAVIFFKYFINFSSSHADKLIIDTDGGVDDALAIYALLQAENYKFVPGIEDHEVIGITCVSGNTHVDNVITNVLKILTLANRTDVSLHFYFVIK